MRTGRSLRIGLAALLCIPEIAAGQDALAKANDDLQAAVKQYQTLSNDVAREEAKLIEEVEKLDYRVLELSKQLRALQGEEGLATKKRQQLDNELELRGVEFDYLLKILRQYSGQLVNHLHVAESQVYEERLTEIERSAESAREDLVEIVKARMPVLDLGAARLLDLAGGSAFQGKAAGPGNTLESGTFALFGPVGFFAGSNGEVAGMTAFQAGDVDIPSILQMDAAARAQVKTLVESGSGTVPVDGSLGKAFQIEEGKKSLREFLRAGGVVGYAIIVLGFLAAGLSVFKLVEIMAFRVPARAEINEILDDLLAGQDEDAFRKAGGLRGLAGRVVEAGADYFHSKRRVLEDALFEKMSAVQPQLERFLPFLAVIAAAAPMAGLLGTVLGIMKTFDMMAQFGTGDAKVTAGGIGEALITTFFGLVVAIPTIMIHGVLKSFARARLGQVEGIALAMINGTTEIPKKETESSSKRRSEDPDEEEEEDEEELLETALAETATSP